MSFMFCAGAFQKQILRLNPRKGKSAARPLSVVRGQLSVGPVGRGVFLKEKGSFAEPLATDY